MKEIDPLSMEEDFHAHDLKLSRKQRSEKQAKDRSKYKKSNQRKKAQEALFPGCYRGRVLNVQGPKALVAYQKDQYDCTLKGALKKEKSHHRNLLCVGDFVYFHPETGVIQQIEERYSHLTRQDPHKPKQHLIAVNIDQVLITTSVVSPSLKPFLLDRYMIAAKKGRMHPVVVFNKMDLVEQDAKEKQLLQQLQLVYQELAIDFLTVSSKTKKGLRLLKKQLQGHTSVFCGQSGVGKTSLINKLFSLSLPTSSVMKKNQKGVHTTTSTRLIPLEKEGFCIDTPGIKSFGIWELEKQDLLQHFHEITLKAANCHYPNCLHRTEPKCAVKECIEKGEISFLRFDSFQYLLDEWFEQQDRLYG